MSGYRPSHGVRPDWPRVPDGVRVYAVGDVHGRADLLDVLLARIAADARSLEAGTVPRLVMLGDYVDRGPDSRGVVDRLAGGAPLPAMDMVALKGNHEDMMLRVLYQDAPDLVSMWTANGGIETLRSYGIDGLPPEQVAATLHAVLPRAHRRFLDGLDLFHVCGDYLFVHAGIEPGVPLERQTALSMMWIREPFLSSIAVPDRVVVHGHTIHAAPDERPNRIGIDTGAYASDVLTCLVLEGPMRRYLQTT